jgi:hypothetical protein
MPTMLSLVVVVTLATRSWAACSMSGWYSSASAAVASPQTSATGTITDGSGNYPNNQECYQAIVPTGAATVSLSFSAFSTESGYDKLYIYDGTSTSSRPAVLNGVSGPSLPAAVHSSGTTMLVKFYSDGSYTESGFAATWTSASALLSTEYVLARPSTYVLLMQSWRPFSFA